MRIIAANDDDDDLFIDLRKPTKEMYTAISEKLGVNVRNNNDLLKVVKKDFAKKLGKIGVILIIKGKSTKILLDDRFDTDPSYRQKVLSTRWTPEWLSKVNNKKNKVDIDNKVEKITKKMNPKSPEAALKVVASQYPINMRMIKKSLSRLKKEDASKKTIRLSIEQGVRLGMLAHYSLLYSDKLCIMTETASKVPDMEHRFLEGLVYPCPKVMEILSRFGCQHNFEVVEFSNKEKSVF